MVELKSLNFGSFDRNFGSCDRNFGGFGALVVLINLITIMVGMLEYFLNLFGTIFRTDRARWLVVFLYSYK